MSKMFDALKRASEIHNDILKIVDPADELSSQPERAARHVPLPETAPVSTVSTPKPAYRVDHLRLSATVPAVPFDGSASRASEQYRLIRTRILHDERNPRLLLISSPTPGDGKSLTAINLAVALALRSDNTVLLLDGDLRRPTIAPMLGLENTPGLGAVLEGTADLQDAVVGIAEVPGLYVLPTGRTQVNPTELLDSERWRNICVTLRQSFSYVVMDSPPISSVADYELLEQVSDGVVIVVRPDHTKRSMAFKVLESVPREKQLGLIVNCATDWLLFRPPHPYYYSEYR
jgi:capsular exopolysaccharide synthesis family protein